MHLFCAMFALVFSQFHAGIRLNVGPLRTSCCQGVCGAGEVDFVCVRLRVCACDCLSDFMKTATYTNISRSLSRSLSRSFSTTRTESGEGQDTRL